MKKQIKINNKLTPEKATTYDKVCSLPCDNWNWKSYWFMVGSNLERHLSN
jgi:hypothetical protein